MRLLYCLVFWSAFLTEVSCAKNRRRGNFFDERPEFRLIDHGHCTFKRPQNEKLKFPTMEDGVFLRRDRRRGRGCYKIGGKASILETIRGKIQLYTEMAHKPISSYENNNKYFAWLDGRGYTGEKPYEPSYATPCRDYDRNGCGGTGSCVYCPTCDNMLDKKRKNEVFRAGRKKKKKDAGFKVTHDGKPIECQDEIEKGDTKHIFVRFCLPTQREFMTMDGLSEDLWNNLTDASSSKKQGMPLFIKLRVYNKDVSAEYKRHLSTEQALKPFLGIMPSEPLPWRRYRTTEFAKNILGDEEGQIGCHIITGTLKMPK